MTVRKLVGELIFALLRRMQLVIFKITEVARFDDIVLADPRSQKDQTCFRDTLLAALSLLKSIDPKRFARVRKRLRWVVNDRLSRCAEYQHHLPACMINFQQVSAGRSPDNLAGLCATILVHEATHGEIRCRGIEYIGMLRSRIEHLCVKEEQRFVSRLRQTQPELADQLYHEFDASLWTRSWNMSRTEHTMDMIRTRYFD